jgi:hypothetical protein
MVSGFQLSFDIVTVITLLWVGYHFGIMVDSIWANVESCRRWIMLCNENACTNEVDDSRLLAIKQLFEEGEDNFTFPEQSIKQSSEPSEAKQEKEKVQLGCEYVQKPNQTITHQLKVFGCTVFSYKKKVKEIPPIKILPIDDDVDE